MQSLLTACVLFGTASALSRPCEKLLPDLTSRISSSYAFNPLTFRRQCSATDPCDCAWNNFQFWLSSYSCSAVERSFLCMFLADQIVRPVPIIQEKCGGRFDTSAIAAACSWPSEFAPPVEVQSCSRDWMQCRAFAQDSPSTCTRNPVAIDTDACARQTSVCGNATMFASATCANANCSAGWSACITTRTNVCRTPALAGLMCSVNAECPESCASIGGPSGASEAIRNSVRTAVAKTPAERQAVGEPFWNYCRVVVEAEGPEGGVVIVKWNDCDHPLWRVRLCFENEPRKCYARDGPVPTLHSRARGAVSLDTSELESGRWVEVDEHGDIVGRATGVTMLEGVRVQVDRDDAPSYTVRRSALRVALAFFEGLGQSVVETVSGEAAPHSDSSSFLSAGRASKRGAETAQMTMMMVSGSRVRATFIGLPAGGYVPNVAPIHPDGKAVLSDSTGRPITSTGAIVRIDDFDAGRYESNQICFYLGLGLTFSLIFGVICGVFMMLCMRALCMWRWRKKRAEVIRQWESQYGASICEASLAAGTDLGGGLPIHRSHMAM